MRSCLFLGLAACWASSTTKPPETQSQRVAAPAPEAAKPPPKQAYVLPKQVANTLATEPLAGNVLVGNDVHPSAASARAHTKAGRGSRIAMHVIRDHGDVVEVSTARVADCEGSFDQPYELAAFVRRDQLVPRTKVDVTRAFADGTAVAIDRGAPVEISDAGLVWETGAFTATKVLPREDQLAYAVPPSKTGAALPQLAGDRLVCDKTNVMTMAEWHAEQRREHEAQIRARDEARRAEIERRRAEMERRRPEIEREQKARAARERKECEKRERARAAKAKKQPKKHGPKTAREDALEQARNVGILGNMSTCAVSSVFGSGGFTSGVGDAFDVGAYEGFGSGLGYRASHPPPFCGVHDPSHYHAYGAEPPKVAPPAVNGNPIAWPAYRADNRHVIKHGSSYLAEVGYRCGRLRVAVDAAGVRSGGGGAAGIGGGKVSVWIPAPGPVTWPDGSPAGRYTGSKKYSHVVENGDRFCVAVRGVAELVCHPKQTTTTGMSYRSGLD